MTTATVVEPPNIAKLPHDHIGRPIPAFVEWIDGSPDFRVMRGEYVRDADRFALCWVCGQRRGRYATFTIGPMCAVNRTSAEPPSHLDCARYAAQACPFLTRPSMVRREKHLPEEIATPAGEMITRNPGVTLLWTTKRWDRFPDRGGWLFEIGEPESVEWWAEGRTATRAEVSASIESGLPALAEIAEQEGTAAVRELGRRIVAAVALVPA